jgi:hypothetical protein
MCSFDVENIVEKPLMSSPESLILAVQIACPLFILCVKRRKRRAGEIQIQISNHDLSILAVWF